MRRVLMAAMVRVPTLCTQTAVSAPRLRLASFPAAALFSRQTLPNLIGNPFISGEDFAPDSTGR
jgi:hypothetical protein